MRRAVLRLHGRMRQVRDGVFRFDTLRRAGERCGDITVGLADLRVLGVERCAHTVGDRSGREAAVAAIVPDDRQSVECAFCAPPGIGHHRNGVRHPHHAANAFHRHDGAFVDRLRLAAVNRTLCNGGVKHAGQPHVDRVDRLCRHLVAHIEPPLRRARERPLAGLLELDVLGRRDLRRVFGDGAECQPAAARPVRDRAGASKAFRGRDIPSRRGGGDQHLPRGGAGLAQIKLRVRDRAAGAGRHIAPNFMAAQIFDRRDKFSANLRPVAFKFLRHQHGKTGLCALPHLGMGNADDDRIIRVNHQPCRDFRERPDRVRGAKRNPQGKRNAAAHSADPGEEGTAAKRIARYHLVLFNLNAGRLSPLPGADGQYQWSIAHKSPAPN